MANIKLALHPEVKLSKILRLLLYATVMLLRLYYFEFAPKTRIIHRSTVCLKLNNFGGNITKTK